MKRRAVVRCEKQPGTSIDLESIGRPIAPNVINIQGRPWQVNRLVTKLDNLLFYSITKHTSKHAVGASYNTCYVNSPILHSILTAPNAPRSGPWITSDLDHARHRGSRPIWITSDLNADAIGDHARQKEISK